MSKSKRSSPGRDSRRAGPALSVTFTAAGFRRGFVRALPIGAAIFLWGITFGLMGREAGLSAPEATLMSVLVYSGTAQAATVGGIAAGAGILAGMATVLMLNARYLFYGASLRPWLGQCGPAQAYATLWFLGDANWAMSTKANADGEHDAAFILGSGLSMYLPWIAGTLSGALAGNWIADPRTLGVDFLLVAFCAAMAMDLFKSRADVAPALTAAAVAALLDRLAPSGWTLVAAGLVGGLAAWLRHEEPA